jgi:hypothetical protein
LGVSNVAANSIVKRLLSLSVVNTSIYSQNVLLSKYPQELRPSSVSGDSASM